MIKQNGLGKPQQSKFPWQSKSLGYISKLVLICLGGWLSMGQLRAVASENLVGVVKSSENQTQWPEITNRLKAAGVNYCVVNSRSWQQESDLGKIDVLFLPNVSTVNGSQASSLRRWMESGGKLIVAGPTGNTSSPQVRGQLRSLFGAYWAFSLSSPKTLQLMGDRGASSTLVGGVLIPDSASRTAAVWMDNGTPAAVVVTDQTTVLGWRWGFNRVAASEFDQAWIKTALHRYSIATQPERLATEDINCTEYTEVARTSITQPPTPQSSPEPIPNAIETKIDLNSPLQPIDRELERLIARLEASLLRASALNFSSDLTTSAVVAQILSDEAKSSLPKNTSLNQPQVQAGLEDDPTKQLNHQQDQLITVIAKAKAQMQTFRQLAANGKEQQARNQAVAIRRLLWENYPLDLSWTQPEVRGIWLDRGTIVQAKSEADLALIFDRLAAAGINTVFFETVNASYTIYPSQVAPEQNPLVQGWDPLAAAVKLAKQRNMELHAWVWIFAGANRRHNLILEQPQDYLGPVLSRHPDWAITDRQGNIFHPQSHKAFFDPAHPEVQSYLLSLLEEIATRYEVDGIQIDYIRYPFQDPSRNQTFGYSKYARQEFQRQSGIDPLKLNPRHPRWVEWNNFRLRQINRFVAQASKTIKQQRPDIILSAAVFPMPKSERVYRIQQHWEHWVRQGWIDWLVPMTYATDAEELEKLTQPVITQPPNSSVFVLPGVRLLDVPDLVAFDQVQFLRSLPTEGYSLFAAENFDSNLANIFSRSHPPDYDHPLPHRQPHQAIALRYQTLQQEWNFLLLHQQLQMDSEAMQDWGQAADDLRDAIQQLEAQPSPQTLRQATSALARFRRNFPQWMQQHRQNYPYQVQIWENHLIILERLMRYSEKALSTSSNNMVKE